MSSEFKSFQIVEKLCVCQLFIELFGFSDSSFRNITVKYPISCNSRCHVTICLSGIFGGENGTRFRVNQSRIPIIASFVAVEGFPAHRPSPLWQKLCLSQFLTLC